jgi:hypothetical protein
MTGVPLASNRLRAAFDAVRIDGVAVQEDAGEFSLDEWIVSGGSTV